MALRAGLTRRSCASVASSTSTGDTSPLAKRRAISRADSQFSSSAIAQLFGRFARGNALLDIALQDVGEAVEGTAERDAPGQFDDLGFGEMFAKFRKDFVTRLAPVVVYGNGIFDDELGDGVQFRGIRVIEQAGGALLRHALDRQFRRVV